MSGINRSLQTIAALVENRAGVLARVSDLFARRGYNIHSLTVAPTPDPAFSRITIVVNVDSAPLEQVVKQLFKLVNVVEIEELIHEAAYERELLIAVVNVATNKPELMSLITNLNGNVLTDSDSQLAFSVEANPSQINQLEKQLEGFDIISQQRSGRIAAPKIGVTVPKTTAKA